MKKVYEPLPMIMNGRYAVLYGKLSAKEKDYLCNFTCWVLAEEP